MFFFYVPRKESDVDVFLVMEVVLNELGGEVKDDAGDMAKLIDRVGVAAMVVLRLDTGVGLLLELKVWRIGLARSSDEELKSSFVGVDGKVGDSGSANALCGTSPGLRP
jgi:hypothetical protein